MLLSRRGIRSAAELSGCLMQESGSIRFFDKRFRVIFSDEIAVCFLSCICIWYIAVFEKESTGKYWVPVFNILEERKIRVTIANPKWVKAVKSNKDDTKDSKWIGDLFRLGLVPGNFISPRDIRILREFTRYRSNLRVRKSHTQP